jgi:NAD+ synthase (glutamine-hydrolysing)
MKLGLAQINSTIGDLRGNVARCLDAIARATDLGAELIVLPEMIIPGYPPRDLLYDPTFVEATLDATCDLALKAKGMSPVLVGSIARSGRTLPGHPGLYNVAYLLKNGESRLAATKRLLPVYDVFLEPRWFLPGEFMPPIEVAGRKIGILVCEDMWDEGYPVHPAQELRAAGADVLVCLSDLPFRKGAMQKRLHHAGRHGLPIALVNLVGGNDELIFDGHSFVMDERGEMLAQLAGFEEDVQVVEMPTMDPGPLTVDRGLSSMVYGLPSMVHHALLLGLRDFARKNGMNRAFLGLSGGIDSSVAAVLTAEALGSENVTGVAIPSRYTDPRSTESARELAESLGMNLEVVEMEACHRSAEETLGNLLEGGTAAENVQARLRMLILMSFVNKHGGFLVNTSNKTELTVGYGTLYGDLAGAISPLGDLTKPEVYELARHINATRNVIPSFVLERAPSAELKSGQVDPFDYDSLAPELERLVLENRSNPAMRHSEHKRQQFGIILKVSEKSFGSGRLMPVAKK